MAFGISSHKHQLSRTHTLQQPWLAQAGLGTIWTKSCTAQSNVWDDSQMRGRPNPALGAHRQRPSNITASPSQALKQVQRRSSQAQPRLSHAERLALSPKDDQMSTRRCFQDRSHTISKEDVGKPPKSPWQKGTWNGTSGAFGNTEAGSKLESDALRHMDFSLPFSIFLK